MLQDSAARTYYETRTGVRFGDDVANKPWRAAIDNFGNFAVLNSKDKLL